MPQPRIPSYRLHKPSGQAVVTLEGHDVYLGRHDTKESLEQYERVVLAWRAHGTIPRRRQTASAPPLTIASMVAAYWRHLEATSTYTKNGKPTSERSCMAIALRPLVRLFGTHAAAEFGPQKLIVVREALCDPEPEPAASEKHKRLRTRPVVRSSANRHVHRIRRVFRWAASMELIPATTWQSLRAVEALRPGQNANTREAEPIEPPDLRGVVTVLRRVAPAIAILIRAQWLTGARPGELVQLRMCDVERRGAVWVFRPPVHKLQHRGQAREVLIGPRAQRALATLLSLDPDSYLFPGRAAGSHLQEKS